MRWAVSRVGDSVTVMASVLAPLLDLADVGEAVRSAREAVDAALRRPALRRDGGPAAVEAALRSAVASAALEGHRHDLDEVRSGVVTDPVVQGALRVSAALNGPAGLAGLWRSAPRQVLARLHVLAARGCPGVEEPALGRPTPSPDLPADLLSARLDALCDLVVATDRAVPAILRAAVIHGELLGLRPFAGPNGVVARAAGRLTLVADGLDPRALLAPEEAHLAREPEYVGGANAFATGTPDGVRSWLRHCAAAVSSAADDLAARVGISRATP
jgi:hypothetical protein